MAIILLVLAVAVPVGIQLLHMKTTVNSNFLFPQDAPALAVYNEMQRDFSAGAIAPFYVIVDTGRHDGVLSQAYYEALTDFTKNATGSSWGV